MCFIIDSSVMFVMLRFLVSRVIIFRMRNIMFMFDCMFWLRLEEDVGDWVFREFGLLGWRVIIVCLVICGFVLRVMWIVSLFGVVRWKLDWVVLRGMMILFMSFE